MTDWLGLVRVEVRRNHSRRIFAYAAALIVAVTSVLGIGAYFSAKPLTEKEIAYVKVKEEEEYAARWTPDEIARCLDEQVKIRDYHQNFDLGCGRAPSFISTAEHPDAVRANFVASVAPILLMISFALGASFVGAEFSTGAITTHLSFEPRRQRVFSSKIVAIAGLSAVTMAISFGLLIAGGFVIVELHQMVKIGESELPDAAGMALRGAVLATALAVLGAALGFLFRRTVVALVIGVIYYVVIDGALLQVFGPSPWVFSTNLASVLDGGSSWRVERCSPATGECFGGWESVSLLHSAIFMVAVVAVALLASSRVFRQRDLH